jgi:Leucine-rich repeat (LRR) protein
MDMTNCLDLRSRDINNEQLAQMVASGEIPRDVTKLNLSFNEQITDITPLGELTNLKNLSLFCCEVCDITPLSSLVNLEELDLECTNVVSIEPLGTLTKLRYLDMLECSVADYSPLNRLPNLEFAVSNNYVYAKKKDSTMTPAQKQAAGVTDAELVGIERE